MMEHVDLFKTISIEYALLVSFNSAAFMMAAQTSMYVAGYEKASIFVMCMSIVVLVYRPLFYLQYLKDLVSQALQVIILLAIVLVLVTRRKGTKKSIAGYAALSVGSFAMGLLIFSKISANTALVPRICDSTEKSCLQKLGDQRRLDVGFADMIQSKFYFEDCMYGEAGIRKEQGRMPQYCRDNFIAYQMSCEERGIDPMQVMTNFQKDTGPSYLPWPPVDPAPKRASNPYAWVGVHMASEWFDNKFWVDLGVRAVYLIAEALLQVHPMENGKLTLERIAALDVRLVEVLFTLSAPTFAVSMIMLGLMDPYFDTSTLRVAAIMAGAASAFCVLGGLT